MALRTLRSTGTTGVSRTQHITMQKIAIFYPFVSMAVNSAILPALIYVAYNGWYQSITITLPAVMNSDSWYRAGDTAAWMESQANFEEEGQEDRLGGRNYEMKGRSLLIPT